MTTSNLWCSIVWFEDEEDKYGLTCVYFNKIGYQNYLFVLATQVH